MSISYQSASFAVKRAQAAIEKTVFRWSILLREIFISAGSMLMMKEDSGRKLTHVCRMTNCNGFEFSVYDGDEELFLGDPSLADDAMLNGLTDTAFGKDHLKPYSDSLLGGTMQGNAQLYGGKVEFGVRDHDVRRYAEDLKAHGWRVEIKTDHE